MPLLFQWRRRLDHRPVSETVLRTYLDHALTAIGVKDAAGQPMRYTFHDFRQAVHHRRHHARHATAHRPTRRRPPRHQHHHGIQGRLPRGSDQRPPRLHRPPPRAAPQRGIPHPHRRRMGRVRRPLRTPQGRHRRLRPLLRHPLHPRTQLSPLPAAATGSRPPGRAWKRSATTSSPASPKPNPTAGTARPRASRSASPARTPNSPRWTRSAPAAPRPSNSASPASPTPPAAPPPTRPHRPTPETSS